VAFGFGVGGEGVVQIAPLPSLTQRLQGRPPSQVRCLRRHMLQTRDRIKRTKVCNNNKMVSSKKKEQEYL
jgi:hypothetical protein